MKMLHVNGKGSENLKDFQRKVMCFGTFDLLHLGHLNYFEQAKNEGDYLIVVVACDKTVKQEGKKIFFSEKERLKFAKELRIVDEAVLGDQEDKFKVIREKKPDMLCLGYDQQVQEKSLREKFVELGLKVEIKRMKSFHANRYKSSLIKKLV